MTEFPSDSAGEPAVADEPAAEFAFTGFDAELAAALKDLGDQVGPDEFDSRAIRRRTARRGTTRVLASSAAALAVVAGVTAFAAQHGPAKVGTAQVSSSTSSGPAVKDPDPLVVPGHFGTEPKDGSPLGSTVYQANARMTGIGGVTSLRAMDVQTEYSSGGTEYTVDVGLMGSDSLAALRVDMRGSTVVGTVAGHPAYYNRFMGSVVFWAGSQGYAQVYRLDGPLGNAALADSDSTMLLGAAKAFVATPSDLPLPLRITGLDSAEVIFASYSQVDPGSSARWTVRIRLTIDGRTYEIDANPGPAVTPSATASETTGGEFPAMKTVDGVGISVSTDSGTSGSPSAPTVAQVLAHVASLGTDQADWTTDVIIK